MTRQDNTELCLMGTMVIRHEIDTHRRARIASFRLSFFLSFNRQRDAVAWSAISIPIPTPYAHSGAALASTARIIVPVRTDNLRVMG